MTTPNRAHTLQPILGCVCPPTRDLCLWKHGPVVDGIGQRAGATPAPPLCPRVHLPSRRGRERLLEEQFFLKRRARRRHRFLWRSGYQAHLPPPHEVSRHTRFPELIPQKLHKSEVQAGPQTGVLGCASLPHRGPAQSRENGAQPWIDEVNRSTRTDCPRPTFHTGRRRPLQNVGRVL